VELSLFAVVITALYGRLFRARSRERRSIL